MQVPGDVALLVEFKVGVRIRSPARPWGRLAFRVSAPLYNETPLHVYCIVIIIIYVALYSLKHSTKPIFSSNPQNKPVRTE